MKLKLTGIDKALQCDNTFTKALAKNERQRTGLKGGVGSKILNERELTDAKERKRKLEADRIVQQTLMNAKLVALKKAKK